MLNNCGNSTSAANGCDQTASNGFVLNTSQIPTHTQTAFGKGSNATFIGYSDFVYTTGDIAKTLLTNLKDSNTYHVHRSASGYYTPHHDPENTFSPGVTIWSDTLTYDKTGGMNYSWAFDYRESNPVSRGYNMNGSNQVNISDYYAWTVWVR
jgi:hypothetical protein